MALPTALLDANVLYAPRWSEDIHAEWIRSVLADRPDLSVDMLERTSTVMNRHFPDAVVTGYSAHTAGLDLPDPDDIHVLAAAIEAGADTIVTRKAYAARVPASGIPVAAAVARVTERRSSGSMLCSRVLPAQRAIIEASPALALRMFTTASVRSSSVRSGAKRMPV